MTARSCTLTSPGATAKNLFTGANEEGFEMTCWLGQRHMRRRIFAATMLAAALFGSGAPHVIFALNALAEDSPTLVQLAQLTVQKGFKNISLGDVCDRLHIGIDCRAYPVSYTHLTLPTILRV